MPAEITDVANGRTNGSKIHGTKNDAAVPFQGEQSYGMPNDLVVSKVLDLETTDERLWVYLHFLPTPWNAPTNKHPLPRSPKSPLSPFAPSSSPPPKATSSTSYASENPVSCPGTNTPVPSAPRPSKAGGTISSTIGGLKKGASRSNRPVRRIH